MISNDNNQRCQICNAVIGDNNHTGIGGGCMLNVVEPSRKDTFFKFKGLEYWNAKSNTIRLFFVEKYSKVKFRSEFKKSFYNSMVNAERVSKKQVEIMNNWLLYDINPRELEDLTKGIYASKYNSFITSINDDTEIQDFYFMQIEMYKKTYLSSRKNKEIDE